MVALAHYLISAANLERVTVRPRAIRPATRAFEFAFVDAIGTDFKFHWSSSGAPFMTGLAAGTYASTPDPFLPVYLNGTLVFGQTPATTLDTSC